MTKKKTLVLMFALIVLVTTLSACKNTDNATESPIQSSLGNNGPLSKPGTFPIVKSGNLELTIGAQDNYYAPKSLTTGLPVWNEVEKKTGIKINWDVTPSSQYADTMKLRLAAAKNLPDIVYLPIGPVDASSKGLIVPLDDLIDKYAPNIKKFFADNPDIYKRMRNPDGKIYAISSVVTGAAMGDPYGLLVRQDWLDKLHLQQPTTADEWYQVLKAFKEKDPNGNGKADEIPFSPGDDEKMNGLTLFGSAFDLHLYFSRGYYPDKDGKIQYEWMLPKAKDFVTWLNKLYKDGLIDPQFLTNGDAETLSNITRNLVGSTQHFLNNTNRYNAAQKQANVVANWQLAIPPSSSAGGKGNYEKYGPLGDNGFAITKDAKNPELAIRWLDYVYASEEGNRYVSFGIEGKSYTMVNGKPEFTDWVVNNPDKLSFNEALRSLGAMPTVAWIRNDKPPLDRQQIAIMEKDPFLQKQADRIKSHLVDAVPFGLPTNDETQLTAPITTDIQTYMDQTLALFITGQKPINWDEFVSTLKSMGIDKLIEAKQKQYDRVK